MAASLTLRQTRTNLPANEGFKVENQVIATTDMPTQLFMFSGVDDTFSHVATLTDLAFPTVKTLGYDYYRKDTCEKIYDSVSEALEFANHVKTRLEFLQQAYTPDYDSFVGTEDTVIPTP